MPKYVKLGEKAELFYDSVTRVKVVKGEIVVLTVKQSTSPKVKRAIIGGHLSTVSKTDYEKYKNPEPEKDDDDDEVVLEELTKTELTAYYKSTYEVDEDDVTIFSKLNKSDMLSELEELAKV